ncbi:MAG TPA: hypothetical protein PLP06_08340 [Saprospiraceae bacterium]|nr:hypothetical protein [Saprospiraceae bacterium]
MDSRETVFDLIKLFWSNRYLILRNVLITGAVATVICLFLPNYYRASSVFYAASTDIMKPEHIFGQSSQPMEYYGSGLDLDRMLTVAQSNDLVDKMVDSFGLYHRYDIDSTGKLARFKVQKAFRALYSVKKTKLDAIELSIEDKDAEVSARMANAAREKINEISSALIKENLNELANTIENTLQKKQIEIKVLNDSIDTYREKYKIIDPGTQAELMVSKVLSTETKLERDKERLKILETIPGVRRDTINMIRAMVAGLQKEFQSLTDTGGTSIMNMERFNAGRNVLEILLTQQRQAKDYIASYGTRYNQLVSVLNSKNNALHLVEKADIPLIKSRPIRSVIIILSMTAALFFTLFLLIFMRTIRDPKWKSLWNG